MLWASKRFAFTLGLSSHYCVVRLKKLDDERHRKLENLRTWDRDHAEAVAWLRNNQSRFKMEVFEPPMICCNVPDKKFTNAVEACFNANQLKVNDHRCIYP